MQIFEQKYITKMIYLYTLQNTIFQRTLCGSAMPSVGGSGAALFVRKRTLFAPAVRWMWRSHVGYEPTPDPSLKGRGVFLCCRPRAVVTIVVIVALAGLVVLGGQRGFLADGTARAKLLR